MGACCAKSAPAAETAEKVPDAAVKGVTNGHDVTNGAVGPANVTVGLKPDIGAYLTVKDDCENQEYYDLFWTHGNSKTIEVRGKTFTLPAPRSDFVDEARTTIYKNTKNEKELFINCYSVDMKTMGEMMGGTEFQEMGAMMWDMDPATGLKIRNAEGGGDVADICVFVSLKEGTSPEEYLELFWSHADTTELSWKGEKYDVGQTRSALCDESRTKVFQNSKEENQLMIHCFDCQMGPLGELMGHENFAKMMELGWNHDGMEFLTSPPPPPQNIGAYLTIKDDATNEEYYNLFWAHADSKVITVRDKEFQLPAARSAFVDESKTTVYTNTKNEKELFINCYDVNMPLMGEMMGGEAFRQMGEMVWDMDPATGLKLRQGGPVEGQE